MRLTLIDVDQKTRKGGGGEGGYSTNVYAGRLCPEVQPLTLLYTIFHKKVPLLYTFYRQMVSLSNTLFRTLYPFNCCKFTF